MDSIFFPFIGGKDWFFRFAVELSLIAAFLWWAFEARTGEIKDRLKKLFKKPLVIAVTVFVGAFLLGLPFRDTTCTRRSGRTTSAAKAVSR